MKWLNDLKVRGRDVLLSRAAMSQPEPSAPKRSPVERPSLLGWLACLSALIVGADVMLGSSGRIATFELMVLAACSLVVLTVVWRELRPGRTKLRAQPRDQVGEASAGQPAASGLERQNTQELTRTVDELRSSLDRAARVLAVRRVEALRPLGRDASDEIRSAVATIDRILPTRSATETPRSLDAGGVGPTAGRKEPDPAVTLDEAFRIRVRTVAEAGVSDPDFNVEALAQELGMDRSHLYRRVRAVTGESPSKMIRHIRLERAAGLLRSQAGTVSEIAYQVGFKSLAHFSSAFRARYRVPPSTYGKQLALHPAALHPAKADSSGVRRRQSLGTC